MNLLAFKIHRLLDKIRTLLMKYIVKSEEEKPSGEHIDNRKTKEVKHYDRI